MYRVSINDYYNFENLHTPVIIEDITVKYSSLNRKYDSFLRHNFVKFVYLHYLCNLKANMFESVKKAKKAFLRFYHEFKLLVQKNLN